MDDCIVVGAGVVGLSIAYELSKRGQSVHVIDRKRAAQEASWAGAGILPAAVQRPGDTAYHQLSGLSRRLHAQWSDDLRAETGIDNEYVECGEILLSRDAVTEAELESEVSDLRQRGIEVHDAAADLEIYEPALASAASSVTSAVRLPGSGRLRNPRHLKALQQACRNSSVRFTEHSEVIAIRSDGQHVSGVETASGIHEASKYCITAGAWSGSLLAQVGCEVPLKPMRGQIVLLKLDEPLFHSVIYEGPYYLVPRSDGHVLVGSTVEDVGFDKRTTSVAIRELLNFAIALVPDLESAAVERCWAGLRPGNSDGRPFIGWIPGFENALVATGHFRWGLFMSPGTAVVVSQLVCGETPDVALDEFRVDRHSDVVS